MIQQLDDDFRHEVEDVIEPIGRKDPFAPAESIHSFDAEIDPSLGKAWPLPAHSHFRDIYETSFPSAKPAKPLRPAITLGDDEIALTDNDLDGTHTYDIHVFLKLIAILCIADIKLPNLRSSLATRRKSWFAEDDMKPSMSRLEMFQEDVSPAENKAPDAGQNAELIIERLDGELQDNERKARLPNGISILSFVSDEKRPRCVSSLLPSAARRPSTKYHFEAFFDDDTNVRKLVNRKKYREMISTHEDDEDVNDHEVEDTGYKDALRQLEQGIKCAFLYTLIYVMRHSHQTARRNSCWDDANGRGKTHT